MNEEKRQSVLGHQGLDRTHLAVKGEVSAVVLLGYDLLGFVVLRLDVYHFLVEEPSLFLGDAERIVYFLLQFRSTAHEHFGQVVDCLDTARQDFFQAADVNVVGFETLFEVAVCFRFVGSANRREQAQVVGVFGFKLAMRWFQHDFLPGFGLVIV